MRHVEPRHVSGPDSTKVANASRPVANLAALLTVALLAVGAVSFWWIYRAIKRARIEARYAEAAQAVADATAKADADVAQHLAAKRLAALDAFATQQEQIVDDLDRSLLWASPTQGAPISLAYVPAGTQCLVHLRPAQLAAHLEGEKVLAALGTWGEQARAQFNTFAGATLEEVDAALVSLLVARDGSIDASMRLELTAHWDEAELAKRFPEARKQTLGDQTYLVDGKRAWFLAPVNDNGARVALVTCPVSMVQGLIEAEGDAPLLARDIEGLVATSDAERTATAIVGAKFLTASGTHLIEGEAEPLRDAIGLLLEDDATAASLSLHWGDAFFAELRATPALTVPSRWLATTLQTRIADAADDIKATTSTGTWSDYGRGVVLKFPAMIRKLAQMSRHGEADKQAVVRAYLPAAAGHNLMMAAELILTQATTADPSHVHADAGMAPTADAVASIDERLAKVTSLVFPKETLQEAIELLAEDIGVAIEIDGAALRAEGITQNQSLVLAERDKPAAEILVAVLRLANPDRSAAGPADPRQKLVYVVDSATASPARMIVTTRAAAAESGRALPAVFGGSAE